MEDGLVEKSLECGAETGVEGVAEGWCGGVPEMFRRCSGVVSVVVWSENFSASFTEKIHSHKKQNSTLFQSSFSFFALADLLGSCLDAHAQGTCAACIMHSACAVMCSKICYFARFSYENRSARSMNQKLFRLAALADSYLLYVTS